MNGINFATSIPASRRKTCPFARVAQLLRSFAISRRGSPVAVTRRWLEESIVREHPELGRAGHVCPFMRQSLNQDRTVLEVLHSEHSDVISSKVLELGKKHLSLPQSKKLLNTIVLVLPGISGDTQGFARLMHIHSKLKPDFTSRGQMLGEFHPLHDGEGIHNPHFRPLRSPIPLIVIRHMVPADILFLFKERQYLEHFLERFSLDELSPEQRGIAERARESL